MNLLLVQEVHSSPSSAQHAIQLEERKHHPQKKGQINTKSVLLGGVFTCRDLTFDSNSAYGSLASGENWLWRLVGLVAWCLAFPG